VGFAQALIAEPRLLLLDEPSSGLDPIGMREARDWIARAKARGCSVLVSSHLLSEVERICDSVVILHEGSVVAAGSIGEIVREGEELEDAFMRIVGAGSAPQPGGRGGG
jgi:ABC-2 type transport system ATP-binding protein